MIEHTEETQLSLNLQVTETVNQKSAVECFGITFESDEARRAYFLEKLREKLKDPEFRQIEGFPIGEDDDILAISDPPYYTACPNPFIADFINYWNQEKNTSSDSDNYHREPFAADVSEGRNDPIYNTHSYVTKVPHKAIMRYILHYTEPGDIVFDGFCGSGMTGVAAQLCGDIKTVESLGYTVKTDRTIVDKNNEYFSSLGIRKVILNDISTSASFISYNYNTSLDLAKFETEIKSNFLDIEEKTAWMYLTLHQPSQQHIDSAISLLELETSQTIYKFGELSLPFGKINYTIWSDVFICPECSNDLVFWEVAINKEAGKVHDNFPCPQCNVNLNKRNLERSWIYKFDPAINQSVKWAKQVPVIINYSINNKRFEKKVDIFDLALLKKIDNYTNNTIDAWFPTNLIPNGYNTEQPKLSHGITHIHQFYTKRNLISAALFFSNIKKTRYVALLTAVISDISKMSRVQISHYFKGGGGPFIPGLAGTLYISSISSEKRTLFALENRLSTFLRSLKQHFYQHCLVNNASTSQISNLPSNSINYIFTDPPFGGNIMYSELNFLVEVWLKVLTNNKPEAIVNRIQGKQLIDYQAIMTKCFQEYYRVLKPACWMTVEFHNSKNSVWNAIQEALQNAGFVIADVRTLDKQQGTFKQVTSGGAVKQDLIISAYKPSTTLEEQFKLEAGTEQGVWDFIRNHLQQLPVFVSKNEQAETIAERQNYLLFDRMVAFHIQRSVTIPLSASEFYTGLTQRFNERDGMYFLPEQAAEYDRKRLTVREVLQLELFVTDESSAVQWLKQQLTKKPQTFQELHSQFMREIAGWSKFEKSLELSELLEQNFLRYEGQGAIPNQIVSWLKHSSIHREKIREIENQSANNTSGLETKDAILINAAKDKWYVPDPNQATDIEKLREKSLLKEFEEYRQAKKKIKQFRIEAVRTGFKKAWQDRDYKTIIEVAEKIPETVLQEDPKLLMWYDQASTRVGE
ncbi:MAG TPA: DNA methyltransferase [Oculatellaceae cyanobacterium]|jgi:DNA modification methylase